MLDSLVIITFSVIILALVFLFLYFKKFQEVYDLKSRLSQVKELEQRDHETQQVRDNFLAMVVHELRSPLVVIRGSSDVLLKESKSLNEREIIDLLAQIRSSSNDLLTMVNDLLDVSKIESGRFEIFRNMCDLNKILSEEMHRYYSLAEEHNLKFDMKLDARVPEVNIDPEKIKQVMNNLISNALKFTPKGGMIEITSTKLDKFAQVCVSDNGVGISAEIKSKLFHKFVQGRANTVSKDKGTGLGLVIAKGIIEAHGGSIWVEDNKPIGTKFIFTIPLS
jgi:signal transduction histidine kinase